MFKNLVVFISGAASGLGKCTADSMLQKGARVVVFDQNSPERNVEQKDGTESTFSAHCDDNNCIFVKGDVRNSSEVKSAIDCAVEKWGGLDVALNCAGIAISCRTYNPTRDHPLGLHEFKRVLDINVVGGFNVVRLAAETMVSGKGEDTNKGVIINTSSIAAYHGSGHQSAYGASSAALVSMTLPIARDLADYGVRVVTIAPGFFNTPLITNNELPELVGKHINASNVFPNRLGDAREFTHLVESIIENKMINGETIRLDAGNRYEI